MYQSTKTYGHEVGLSCAFRQWKADSHCNKIHGYALSFKFIFETVALDNRNWVVDFGGLTVLKEKLKGMFDHKLVLATDDPLISYFVDLHDKGGVDLVQLECVGCEAFAEQAYNLAVQAIHEKGMTTRVRVVSCECSEHGANSAIYIGEK